MTVCGLIQVYMQKWEDWDYKKIKKDSGTWSVICNPGGRNKKGVWQQYNEFRVDAANVACRQMGFQGAQIGDYKFDYDLKVRFIKFDSMLIVFLVVYRGSMQSDWFEIYVGDSGVY